MRYWGKDMEKKILLGSIVAVVVIVLTSFTSVVGFQSRDTSKVLFSPLFRIRSKKAIDTELKDSIIFNYIGMEKEIILPITTSDSKSLLIRKSLKSINEMEQFEFLSFKSQLNLYIEKNHEVSEQEMNELINFIENVRNKDDFFYTNEYSSQITRNGNLFDLLSAIFSIIIWIILIIPTILFRCLPSTFRFC